MNKSIFVNVVWMYLIVSETDLSSERSAFLKRGMHFNSSSYFLTESKRSSLLSIMRIVGWYFLANSRAICLPIPMHPPVMIIKLSLLMFNFLRGQKVLTMCATIIVQTMKVENCER